VPTVTGQDKTAHTLEKCSKDQEAWTKTFRLHWQSHVTISKNGQSCGNERTLDDIQNTAAAAAAAVTATATTFNFCLTKHFSQVTSAHSKFPKNGNLLLHFSYPFNHPTNSTTELNG